MQYAVLLAYLAGITVSEFIDNQELAWHVWAYTILLCSLSSPVNISRRIVYVLITLWVLADYTLCWVLHLEWAYIFTTVTGCGIFAYIIWNLWYDKYYAKDKYCPLAAKLGQTFLCFSEPQSFDQYLASFFNCGQGSCFLVIGDQKYYFCDGILIKDNHIHNPKYKYKLLKPMKHETVTALLGTRWSVMKNCFTFFRRICV